MLYANFAGKRANVTCIMYLEDWGIQYGELLDFLSSLTIECACSPVHDRDKFSKWDVNNWINDHSVNGKLTDEAISEGVPQEEHHKKSHVHVMLCGDGPRPVDWWARLLEPFHKINYFQSVKSKDSLIRYFAHLDNPEKAQYNPREIHFFGGLDTSALDKTSELRKTEVFIQVMEWVFATHCRSYSQLLKKAIASGNFDVIGCVKGSATTFGLYFKSERDEVNLQKKWHALLAKHPDVTVDELEEVFRS